MTNHTLAKTFASANQIGLIEYIQYLVENKLPPIEDGFYMRSFFDGEKYSKQVRINKKPIISPKNGVFEIAEKQIKFQEF